MKKLFAFLLGFSILSLNTVCFSMDFPESSEHEQMKNLEINCCSNKSVKKEIEMSTPAKQDNLKEKSQYNVFPEFKKTPLLEKSFKTFKTIFSPPLNLAGIIQKRE